MLDYDFINDIFIFVFPPCPRIFIHSPQKKISIQIPGPYECFFSFIACQSYFFFCFNVTNDTKTSCLKKASIKRQVELNGMLYTPHSLL